MSRKMSILLTLLLALSMMLVPAVAGAQDPTTDAQLPAAPRYSHRLVVQLSSPSLATWFSTSAAIAGGAPAARLDVNAPAAQTYIQRLQAEQSAFAATLTRAIPGARIATFMDESGRAQAQTYQVVMNGLVVDAGQNVDVATLERQLRALPGVKQVFRDYEQVPEMYASLPLIGALTMWEQLGGQDMSGEGILIASIDTGVYAPNPFFDPTGYSYPPGFPKGDRRSTTPKVIAARAYFRPWDPPLPTDAGALPGPNSSSHGTHTSGTFAGNANTVADLGGYAVTLSGVAPRAQILSYRIGYPTNSKYSGSAFTAEIIRAYEDAVQDGAQVINYSFGGYSGVMPWADGVTVARDAAWDAGVFVSHSAGNSGPGTGSTGDASPKVIEVAASSTTGTIGSGRLSISAPPPVPADLQDMAFASASFGASLEAGQVYSWPLKTALSVDPANVTGCNPWPEGTFTGKAAVISRGVCEFGVKVLNAEQAGAEFAVIYNSAAGGDTLINMGAGAVGDQVTIPSVFIWRSKGLAINDWYAANGDASLLEMNLQPYQAGAVPDVIAFFSSRGPAYSRYLEPDVTAPGQNILSSGYGSGSGLDRHMGFGQASGTSMAAPHVAGAAALLRQMHPDWTPSQIKSALMTTSVTDVWLDTAQTVPAGVLDMGAGRIDLTKAGDPGLTFDHPSLSFGSQRAGSTATLAVTATDIRAAGDARTYALDVVADAGIAVTVNPASLTFMGGESKTFEVTVDTTGAAPGDYGGMIHVGHGPHMNHIPLWVRVEAVTDAKILLIDNDMSDLLGNPDYSGFYMSALDNLGVPYDYYNADLHFNNAQTLPSAAELAGYQVIIYWTGDNYYPNGTFTVATPLTEIDMQVLTDWQFNGGRLFASGQDLASAWDALDNSGTGYPYYAANLGAGYLQDSIFDPLGDGNLPPVPAVIGQPGSPISGAVLDISGSAPITDTVDGEEVIVGWVDGAANQYYVDEIEIAPYGDVEAPETVQPILTAIDGYGLQAGYLGAARSASPRLEHPAQYSYRSAYLSFGFEAINNNTGYNTREDAMFAILVWLLDEVEVNVTGPGVVANPYDVAMFETSLVSNVGARLASCRLDFGDGSPIAEGQPGGTSFGHVYGAVGAYTVRAECTDSLGFSNIGETTVVVQQGYNTPVTKTYMATGDTFVAQGSPAENYGWWSFLYVGAKDVLRSVAQFDFSAIDPAYPVDLATLWVYVDAFSGADKAAELRAYAVTTPWNADTATWKTPWTTAGGDYVEPAAGAVAISSADVDGWLELDITALVQQWVADPASNQGLILRLGGTEKFTTYRLRSGNYWFVEFGPHVQVTYREP